MRIEFNNNRYRFNHGKAPRGYGWWLFTYEGQEFQHTGTLTEAKKACAEHIRKTMPTDRTKTVRVTVEP